MARPAVGIIETAELADGSSSFRGRFRAAGERHRVVFGRDVDGWTEARARSELDDICAQLKAGIPLAQILERYAPKPAQAGGGAATPRRIRGRSDPIARHRPGLASGRSARRSEQQECRP